MKEVSSYVVTNPTTITFTTTPPDVKVTTYGAKLFKKSGGVMTEIRAWLPGELESGVTFLFDALAGERYEIDLGATVTDLTSMDTNTAFSTHPPDDDPETVDLDPAEGVLVRVWFFFPNV